MKKVGNHCFVFNKQDNGGEQVMLTTEFFHNGDRGGIFTNQTISLQSYCNSASIFLSGAQISSAMLRMLADELEEAENKAKDAVEHISGNS